MPSLWDQIRQGVGDFTDSLGTAVGLPETGLSERIAGGPTVNTKLGGIGTAQAYTPAPNQSTAPGGIYDQSGNQIGSSETRQVVNTPTSSPAPSGGGGSVDQSRYNELKAIADSGNLNPSQKTEWQQMQDAINQGSNSSQDAARAAAEARRKAAQSKYEAMKGIAQGAKDSATDQYNWLIDTIGSNKKDLLGQVAIQEQQGLADYQMQEDKTTAQYDKAKQDILTTYRDLQTQQEKIMRGSGMSSSSRSQEAQLRLSNLMGKDLSTVSTNEADSLALIGNAVSKFKENIRTTNVGIEREATQKLDKAALDYNDQIRAIDNNLTLSAAEREEAYANAEAQLAADTQQIQQWTTGLKLQAQQYQIEMQGKVDDFVAGMLGDNELLGADLGTKTAKTNELLTAMGYTPLDENPNVSNPTVGVYQKARMSYKDKDALDAALQRGEITQSDYNSQLQQMQLNTGTGASVASANPTISAPKTATAQTDPLLRAMFA